MIAIRAIGWKAHDALGRAGGRAELLAALTESIYLTAGDEIIWLGREGAPLHPRAILGAGPLPVAARALALDAAGLVPWRPTAPTEPSAPTVTAAARALLCELRRSAASTPPLGLGQLLVGATPDFPLDRARPHAVALARACLVADADALVAAADTLLGLGPGLTPSGDDFLGGALFARRVLGGSEREPLWTRAAGGVIERARARTHAISVALLSDMVEGQGHAPLHDVAAALADGPAAADAAVAAAHRLGRIGHSSGWDMLTGLLAALLGTPALD